MWRPSLQRKLFGYQEVQCFLKVLSADLLPFSSSYRVSPAIAICLYSNSQPVIKSQDPSFQQRQTSHYSNVSFLAHPNWWFPITPQVKWLSIILAYIWASWCHVPFRIWGSHCAYNMWCSQDGETPLLQNICNASEHASMGSSVFPHGDLVRLLLSFPTRSLNQELKFIQKDPSQSMNITLENLLAPLQPTPVEAFSSII